MTDLTPMTPPVTQAALDAAIDYLNVIAGFRGRDKITEIRDDHAAVLAFAKAIAEETERCARIAEMHDHRGDIATAIRATVGEVGK